MTDAVFVAVLLVFFLVARLFVAACERIIGPDPDLAPDVRSDGDGRGGRRDDRAEQDVAA